MSMKLPANAILVLVLTTLLVACSSVPPTARTDDLCRFDPQPPKPVPRVQIDDLGAIENTVADLSQAHGADKVLVVFDINNTLLTADRDFGSDAWFKWQDAIRTRPDCERVRVSKEFDGLLEVQYLAYSIGEMRPTQADTAALIRRLADGERGVMALTARGPEIRSSTVRELGGNMIALRTAPPCRAGSADRPSLCARRGFISAETILAVAEGTLSARERETLGPDPRRISYADGVMMVSGQNKGLMLRLLLASSPSLYEAIVFVDDGADNVIAVEEAFAGDATPTVKGFWYTAFEDANARFWNDASRQEGTVRAWHTVSAALCEAVGTYCEP